MLAAPDQLSARGFDFGDGGVQRCRVCQAEAEVGHPAAHAREVRPCFVLVQRDEILTARCVEKDHLRPVTKALLHPEYAPIEPERSLEISDHQMDVRQTLGLDHWTTSPGSRRPTSGS